MSFLGISVQPQTARLIHEIEVPGAKQDSGHLHITLLYFGKEVSIEMLAKAMIATFAVTTNTEPFCVKLSYVDYFTVPDGEKFPIIAPVVSKQLRSIRTKLKNSFDEANIEYDKRFKKWNPHVTLSFNEETIKKTRIDPIEWYVQELVLWGGGDGDNRMVITFPLELKKNEDILQKCLK